MENNKKLLNEEELEQVTGGVLKPIHVRPDERNLCPYCKCTFYTKTELDEHIKVCPENPANKKASRAL